MRFYPDIPARRYRAIAGDIAVVVAIIFFAWLGMKVHDTVDDLTVLGRGVQDAGTSVQTGFSDAANFVGNIPIVGGQIKDSLNKAGQATGGNAVSLGRQGEDAVQNAARVLGWATFLAPTLLLLWRAIPRRIERVRRLTEATRAFSGEITVERRRLMAMRAALGLPLSALLPYTPDPLGDFEAGQYDRLLDALFADAGLVTPPHVSAGRPGALGAPAR